MEFIPIFEHGLILKQHMLEALRDYPIELVNIAFSDMGDGVIAGLNIELTEDDGFYVEGGIVKIDGEVYLVNRFEKYLLLEGRNFVYLNIIEKKQTDGTLYEFEIIQKDVEDDSLFELFRYVKNGCVKKYFDIEEVFGNVINRIDQRKMHNSLVGGYSLPNEYFVLYANRVLQSNAADMNDIAFAYQCLNGVSNIDMVKTYFKLDLIGNDDIINAMRDNVERLRNKAGKLENIAIENGSKQKPIRVS